MVITDFGYKFDGLGFAQPEVIHLWVVPAGGAWQSGSPPETPSTCTPTGRRTASMSCSESNRFCDKSIGIAMDILLVNRETLELTQVTRERMIVSYPNPGASSGHARR